MNSGKKLIGRLAKNPGSRRTVFALVVILSAFMAWLVIGAFIAKSNLDDARTSAENAKDSLLSGKSDEAVEWAQKANSSAHAAQSAAHSLPWNIAAAVPFLGTPLKTSQQITNVVVGLSEDVLLPAARKGAAISPSKLLDGKRIELGILREQQSTLEELSGAAARVDASAQAIAKPAYLSFIGTARLQLQSQTSRLARLLTNSSIAAQLAPSMLGGDGPRTYLIGFQTNAEARGTGGLLGGFAVLRFENGTPVVDKLASNVDLADSSARIDLGPEYDEVYGFANPYTDFRNSNLSSHFPYAAQIWKSMWEEKSKTRIDGVIAVDPVALSYVLGALGPISLPDGEVVSQDNVVDLTQSKAYIRFPVNSDSTPTEISLNQIARKKYLQDIAGEVVKKLTDGVQSARPLLDALGRAASERRIAVWSAVPADQELLEQTPLAFSIPEDAAPYAAVVINNLAGNKMDYYLRREIEYVADGCKGDRRNSTVTVRLENTVGDEQLPDLVAGQWGPLGGADIKMPKGTMVTSVRLIATNGATLRSVTLNGERTVASVNLERGHPSFEVQLAIPPRDSAELSFQLSEPTSPGIARVPVQPLIDNPEPSVGVPTCS